MLNTGEKAFDTTILFIDIVMVFFNRH